MPDTDEAQRSLERLAKFGMTQAELDIWIALANVAGRMLQLPELHPNEQEEVVHEIHVIQNRLLARPGLRAVGWPKQ